MIYEYYYSRLSLSEQKIYRTMLKELEEMKEVITIKDYFDIDRFDVITDAIHWDHPELFQIDFHYYLRGVSPEGMELEPSYFYTWEVYQKKKMQMEKVIEKLIQMANKENLGNDLKKCRWIHDRLVRNIVYGGKHVQNTSDISDAHTIEGVFLHKRAVCEGISKAFKLLSDRLGLKSIVAIGVAGMGEGGPHAWNISCLDGNFVQIDATWDGNLSLACQYYRYDFFAVSDQEIQIDHEYTEFTDYPICSTMQYSYFAKKGCLLKNPEQLKHFFDTAFKEEKKAIYFKISGNIADKEKFSQKISEMLYDFMCKYGTINVAFRDCSNKERLVFFYKRELL